LNLNAEIQHEKIQKSTMEAIRDAPIGQLIRFITKNKVLRYPEEIDGFECPTWYNQSGDATAHTPNLAESAESAVSENGQDEAEDAAEDTERGYSHGTDMEKIVTAEQDEPHLEPIRTQTTRQRPQIERVSTAASLRMSHTQHDLETQLTLALRDALPSRPIPPERLEDGTILVDWYTTDDPANPQNWSHWKKGYTTALIW
jgi:DHA1 family multidrug resistance protein-like MFS transporter